MFNDSKTELLIIGSWQQLSKVTIASIKVGDCDIQPLKHVRNLGAWFDSHMSMNTHIGKVCSKAFRGFVILGKLGNICLQNQQSV